MGIANPQKFNKCLVELMRCTFFILIPKNQNFLFDINR